MELESVCWLGILIVLVIIELATLGLTTIWFAGGALIAFIASLLGASIAVQVVLFLAVSVVLLFFTRPLAMKYVNKNRIKTNVDSLIGQKAIVLTDIDNLREEGQVRLDGKEWTARSENPDEIIKAGSVGAVQKISGVKVIVKKVREE